MTAWLPEFVSKTKVSSLLKMVPLLYCLSACATTGTLQTFNKLSPVQLNRQSAPQVRSQIASRVTVGTAKEIYEKAEALAQRWSPLADAVAIEGRFISASGLNDSPKEASWRMVFTAAARPGKAYQIFSRSENNQLLGQEIAAGSLSALEPLQVRAWTLDSSLALKKARNYSEFVSYPVSPLELRMIDQRLIWTIPQTAPLPPLMIDAMQGQQVLPRR
jgi:hypothetical protein